MTTTVDLNDQQRTSVDSMKQLETSRLIITNHQTKLHTRLGVNGNPVGSGKTRAMVALIEELHSEIDDSSPTVRVTQFGSLMHEEYTVDNLEDKNVTIILASGSIRKQWIVELSLSTTLRFKRLDNIRMLQGTNIDDFDVLVVNTTVYKQLTERNIRWRRFIYDEPDSFTIPAMKHLHAQFTWFVTATWFVLINKYATSRTTRNTVNDMYNILRNVDLERIIVYTQPIVGTLPDIQYVVHNYRAPASIIRTVQEHIHPTILAQLDAGDVRGAMAALGGDCSTDHLVDVVRKRLERSLEDARYRLHRGTDNDTWIERIRKIETDIQSVNERFDQFLLQEKCSICTDDFTNPCLTPCQHVYCMECLVTWLQQSNTCPQCRSRIETDELTVIVPSQPNPPSGGQDNNEIPSTNAPIPLSRMDILKDLVDTNRSPEQRIIIFSEHDMTFDTLPSILEPGTYSTLSGHSTTRERVLENFKTGRVPILLLNSRTNGAGIDLPMTTDVILFHQMSDFIREQSIGRGQRLGRTSPLRVHEFVQIE